MTIIDREIAKKVLDTVDAGLCHGVGTPEPGKMCVEAAVCFALGLPHGDEPDCVAPALRALKIRLNDSDWSSNEMRAKGLRKMALLQLGSKDHLDEKEFLNRVVEMTIRRIVPTAMRVAAAVQKTEKHKVAMMAAADRCEAEGTEDSAANAARAAWAARAAGAAAGDAAGAAWAARAAANAAGAAAWAAGARDEALMSFADGVVEILIEMKVPGVVWLDLIDEVK